MLRARDWIFHKVGEDWIFLALLGIIMALLSFAMDFIIEKMQEGELNFSLHTFWFSIPLKADYHEFIKNILISSMHMLSVLSQLTTNLYMLQAHFNFLK